MHCERHVSTSTKWDIWVHIETEIWKSKSRKATPLKNLQHFWREKKWIFGKCRIEWWIGWDGYTIQCVSAYQNTPDGRSLRLLWTYLTSATCQPSKQRDERGLRIHVACQVLLPVTDNTKASTEGNITEKDSCFSSFGAEFGFKKWPSVEWTRLETDKISEEQPLSVPCLGSAVLLCLSAA